MPGMQSRGGSRIRIESAVAWVALMLAVLAVYVMVVLGGGMVIDRTDSPHVGLSVLATVIVAAGFNPARTRLERGVAHLLHLQRPEPVAHGVAEFFARHPMGLTAIRGGQPAVVG